MMRKTKHIEALQYQVPTSNTMNKHPHREAQDFGRVIIRIYPSGRAMIIPFIRVSNDPLVKVRNDALI
jgi:hypothetical protein